MIFKVKCIKISILLQKFLKLLIMVTVTVSCKIALLLKVGKRALRQMELQLPKLSYVVVPSFLLFYV